MGAKTGPGDFSRSFGDGEADRAILAGLSPFSPPVGGAEVEDLEEFEEFVASVEDLEEDFEDLEDFEDEEAFVLTPEGPGRSFFAEPSDGCNNGAEATFFSAAVGTMSSTKPR